MKRTTLLLTLMLAVACSTEKQPQPFSVIPMPNDVTLSEGSFNLAGQDFYADAALDQASHKAIADSGTSCTRFPERNPP